ncbi:ATP-binding protein [Thermopolyspora sp. NPDC052614]|uniref:ATP-binding protein n=1 Tax=Thermopolyspora sp. NPDC052614 TaxID=3155682 RepID=UPI003417D7F8
MAAGNLLGSLDLPGHEESVSEARQFIRKILGAEHPALENATLMVSELVTNSVVHSDSRNGGRVTVVVTECGGLIHVDVIDEGSKSQPRVQADSSAEGGRGLFLVDFLAERWGVCDDAAGRTVWFEVKVDGS